MKTEQLIQYAFKKIGFVQSEENMQGERYDEALFYLNEEISTLNRSGVYVPYFSEVTFNFVAGQAQYTIGLTSSDVTASPFIELNYVNVLWESAYYNVTISTRKFRYDNITYPQPLDGVPGEVLFTRNRTQAILNFYQPPNLVLPCTVYGKQELTQFVSFQDITNVPAYLLKYFRLSCAKQLAGEYIGSVWTDVDEIELTEIKKAVFAADEVNVDIINGPELLNNDSMGDPLSSIYGSI